MVDLVKIRKKAREKAAAEREDAQAPSAPPGSAIEAPVPPPAPKKAQKASRPEAPARAPKNKGDDAQPAPSPRAAGETTAAVAADDQHSTEARPPATGSPAAPPITSKLARFLESAGERRVERSHESQGPSEAQLELLTFLIAGELYAIAIDNVVEIVTPRPVTRIPNGDAIVVGILSLRGMIVTLIDARLRLGHPATAAPTPDTRIIVVQLDHEVLGFSVDKVLRVVKIDADAVEPHPVVHTSEQDDSVRGVFRHADALTIFLDLDKLLNTRAAVPPA